MSDKFDLPPEILQALAFAEIADGTADMVIGVAERIHEKKLGEKAGRFLDILCEELGAVLDPLMQRYAKRQTRIREERMKFVNEHAKAHGTLSAEAAQQTALAVLKMENNEHSLLFKTIENEIWKFRANRAEGGKDSKETWNLGGLGNLVKKN